jgi:signal transduction histidine kinase
MQRGHAFLQLVKLVRGHAEALLHDRFPELPPHEAAQKHPIEGAIYFSTELMLVKMDSLSFLHEVNRAFGNETRFDAHPFVLKYVRIYNWQATQRQVGLKVTGGCNAQVYYNSQAVGALVQGLLDNLVKYAPGGSTAIIHFAEEPTSVRVDFTSLGPRIEPDETEKIFIPGYRARAAQQMEMSGLGVGLATARQVSDALGLDLTVVQDASESHEFPERYLTTFAFHLAKSV